ncbi:MAG: hypothetical protein P8174_01940 [Gemmatimonadota bacterium]
MGIAKEEVRRIAALAGLDPRPGDLERLEAELDGILAQMELLADVPLEEADAEAAEGTAPLRADEPGRDELARPVRELAPDWQAGFFTVPRLAALGDVAAVDGGEGGGEAR